MGVTSQQFGLLLTRRGVNDGIGRGQLVLTVQVRSKQCNGGIERHDCAFLSVRDHVVGLFLAQLLSNCAASEPLVQPGVKNAGFPDPVPYRPAPSANLLNASTP